MKTMKNKIMLMIVAGILNAALSLTAHAAITSGAYSGTLVTTADANKSVKVYIQGQPPTDPDAVYGFILNKDEEAGALYRIEELVDGTQAWFPMRQSSGKYLTAALVPALKGVPLPDGALRLVPSEGSSLCQKSMREITVKPDSSESWQDFRDLEFRRGDRGSEGVLQMSRLSGTLVFKDASHSGSFALSKFAPGLATVRAQVLDPNSLSGWSLSREMLGVAVMTKDQGGFFRGAEETLTILKLPVNSASCMDAITRLRN